MKKYIINIILGLAILSLFSCNPKQQYILPITAQIVERDLTKCGCCGGWIIAINGQQFRTYQNLNLFDTSINVNAILPINTTLIFKEVIPKTCKKEIVITALNVVK